MKAPAIALLLGAALLAVSASAHTIVKDPLPIGTQADLLVEPCGCDFVNTPNKCPATYPVTQLTAGAQFKVTWTELINHAGKFRVSISPLAPELATEADFDTHVLYLGVDTNTTVPTDISATILVPDAPCTKCTLQVEQEATDGPNPKYYSCAAITIVPGTGGAGGADAATAADTGSGSATASAAATSTSGDGGAGPIYVPEPNSKGCSVGSDHGFDSGACLIPVLGAGLILARRRR